MSKKRFRKRRPQKLATELPEGKHAIAAVDPGGTTGLFMGVVTIGSTMKETVATIERPVAGEVGGDFRGQASHLARRIQDYFANLNLDGMRQDNMWVVVEDWDTGRKNPGRELVAVWVMSGMDLLLTGFGTGPTLADQIEYRFASQAKNYATDNRLRLWNLYEMTKGQPHARDASRHWALKVNKLVG